MLWLALTACTPEAPPSPPPASLPATPSGPILLDQRIQIDALMGHLEVLDAIAEAHEGHRAFSSPGYLDSVDYIESTLIDAGFETETQVFTVALWDLIDANLSDADGPLFDWSVFSNSGSGELTADLEAVDLQLPPGEAENSSSSGCEAEDFDAFTPGRVALLQRGSCPFTDKVANAEAAGAVAVLIFNEGQPNRTDVIQGTIAGSSVPVVGLSFELGEALAEDLPQLTVEVEATIREFEDRNLFASWPGTDPTEGTVLMGAHLDSVEAGPGINDNGSGSAFLLETALQIAETGWQAPHTVSFAWWGAEEQGLIGSSRWVYESTTGEPDLARLDGLSAYLNFDMMASSNGARFVYDGDNSDINDGGGSPASGTIEALFLNWFADQNLPTAPEGMFVPTDSWWFILEGVPTGGVFSGALGIKDETLASEQGGAANSPFDPCYHQRCDRVDGINPDLYLELARGGAHVLQALAESPGDL